MSLPCQILTITAVLSVLLLGHWHWSISLNDIIYAVCLIAISCDLAIIIVMLLFTAVVLRFMCRGFALSGRS